MARKKKNKTLRRVRRRLAGNSTLTGFGARLMAGYMRFCFRTSRWDRDGQADMDAVLETGQPVVVIIWHERLAMCPYLFDVDRFPLCAVTTYSPIASLGQLVLGRFGLDAVSFDPKGNPMGATRAVVRQVRNGASVALSPDGSRGPPRVAKPFPIPWIRATKAPVFCVAFSVRRGVRLPTWDRALMPLPFTRGTLIARRWEYEISATPDEAEIEALRRSLDAAANAVTDAADRAAGRALDMSFRQSGDAAGTGPAP